jgi:hypothetical protein
MKKPTNPAERAQRVQRRDIAPDEAIRRARKQAKSSKDDVAKASSEKLKKILSLSKREWWKNLHNADLTPEDQSRLESQLENQPSARTAPVWSTSGAGALRRLWGRSSHRIPSAIKGLIIAAVVGVPIFMSVINTGRTETVRSPGELQFRFPDGSSHSVAFAPGEHLTIVRAIPSGHVVRHWVAGAGYAYAPD